MKLENLTVKDLKAHQRFLKSQGFDPGKIDGKLGPWTEKANSAYEESLKNTAAVLSLQKFLNEKDTSPKLKEDGVYGPLTREAQEKYITSLEDQEDESPNVEVKTSAREKIISVALSLVGIREATGNNDGKTIDDILASCGLRGTQSPYCAAFVVYCGDMAMGKNNNPYPRSAYSPDMTIPKPTWQQGIGGKLPRPADVFGIYFSSQGRIAHTGFIYEWTDKSPYCLTIEGNTGARGAVTSPGAREGDGIYLKRRMKSDFYTIKDWID